MSRPPSIRGQGRVVSLTCTSQPDPRVVERARAFVADVEAVMEKHGFTIRVREPNISQDPALIICRAVGDDVEDVLLAGDDDWTVVNRGGPVT